MYVGVPQPSQNVEETGLCFDVAWTTLFTNAQRVG